MTPLVTATNERAIATHNLTRSTLRSPDIQSGPGLPWGVDAAANQARHLCPFKGDSVPFQGVRCETGTESLTPPEPWRPHRKPRTPRDRIDPAPESHPLDSSERHGGTELQ